MHEVSLRSASNRMDAHNLALVLCPNLVSGSNPARDVMMCSVPGGPTLFESTSSPIKSNRAALSEGRTTLGMIIKLCIQRYYEIFDEVHDRTEALYPERALRGEEGNISSETSSASGNPGPSHHGMYHDHDDDEDIDDAMLVMPIGPSHSHHHNGSTPQQAGGSSISPPSAWGAPGGATSTFKPRHRSTLSGSSSKVRSMHTVGLDSGNGGGGAYAYASTNKAKSMYSIENGTGTAGGRKGSISVGRGTTRKSSGAGVEAIGITAEGFFSAPSSAPPVPPLRRPSNS